MWIWNERPKAALTVRQLVTRLIDELGYKANARVRAYTLTLADDHIRLCVDCEPFGVTQWDLKENITEN